MIGTIIDQRYHIIQNLGKGGFGTTFLAKDTKRPGNPLCVVKHFTPASTDMDMKILNMESQSNIQKPGKDKI